MFYLLVYNMRGKDYSYLFWSKINMLKIIKQVSIRNRSYLECICDCGNTKSIQACDIINNKTKSCGCYNIKSARERWYKHKLSWHKLYKLYYDIIQRCNNKNKKWYENYWGRWIKCEWSNFEDFYKDMVDLYDKALLDYKRPSIERLDVNDNYSKKNCKFIENINQSKNRRMNYNIEWLTLSDYCRKHNLKSTTMYSRYYRNKMKNIENDPI